MSCVSITLMVTLWDRGLTSLNYFQKHFYLHNNKFITRLISSQFHQDLCKMYCYIGA
ncbi:hypothetical protein LINPERPRIM_LOCUS9005 [Linum perenne]